MKRCVKCFKYAWQFSKNPARNFLCVCESDRVDIRVAERQKGMNQELLITCIEVRRELSNYIDDEITAELRSRIEEHVVTCSGCKAIYDGMRNILTLVTATDLIELPRGFSARLYQRLHHAEAN